MTILHRHQRWLLLGLALAFGTFGMTQGVLGQDSSSQADEVERLIAQLGSQEFSKRDAASKALQTIGEPALPPLRKAAAGNPDPEIRQRADSLVDAIIAQVARGSLIHRYQGTRLRVSKMTFSHDGQKVLSYSDTTIEGEKEELVDRTLQLWDLKTEKELLVMKGHPGRVGDLAFSPDDRLALSTGFEASGGPQDKGDTAVRLWDLGTGKELRRFEGHPRPVYSARFSPDGRHLVTSGNDVTVRLWEVETGKELRQFARGTYPLAIFSPCGRFVLSWSTSIGKIRNSVRLWDKETGQELRCFGDDWWWPCLAFSPDGRHIAIGDARPRKAEEPMVARLLLWDSEGQLLRSFEGPREATIRVAFSPDGRRLLSANRKGDIRLWDVETGRELRRFISHTPIVLALAFTPDGKQALTGHTDNSVSVWALPDKGTAKPGASP